MFDQILNLTDLQVSDDILSDQITKSTSKDRERLKCLGSAAKNWPVTVIPSQIDSSDLAKQTKFKNELH